MTDALTAIFRADPDMGASTRLGAKLEALYKRFNRPEWIDPDPLAVALEYPDPRDQETAGLIAALLAFGRVRQIVEAARRALSTWPKPHEGLARATRHELSAAAIGFCHRYAGENELLELLAGVSALLRTHGSLEAVFAACRMSSDINLVAPLGRFAACFRSGGHGNCLLPDPAKGGACKRWFLFLRWMARKDMVDPGLWSCVKPSDLVMPMDTHIHRLASNMGFTNRRAADLRSAMETTAAFAAIRPDDPVRYDFCLTRAAMRAPAALNSVIRAAQQQRLFSRKAGISRRTPQRRG